MPTRAEIKAVAALKDAEERRAQGRMLLEGPHLAFEGLRRGVVLALYVADDCRERDELLRAAEAARVAAEVVPAHEIDRMVEVRTPAGVAAVARLNAPVPLDALLAAHASLVFLEGVQDPGNVGAIARTAAALFVRALVFGEGAADPTSPKALRASAGALLDAPYARDAGVDALLRAARAHGHAVIVADVRQGTDHRRFAPPARRILVVSNEGAGTRVPLDADGVVRVTIPLAPGAESLNVAAAAAILLDRLRGE